MKKTILTIAILAIGMIASAQTVGTTKANQTVDSLVTSFKIEKSPIDTSFVCFRANYVRVEGCGSQNYYYCSTMAGDTTFVGNETFITVKDSMKAWLAVQPCVEPQTLIIEVLE